MSQTTGYQCYGVGNGSTQSDSDKILQRLPSASQGNGLQICYTINYETN